ncbi:MAG: hypothetical protein Q9198_003732 [Flavoplaca austrocitrina]
MLHSRLITMRWRLASTPVYALLSEHGGRSIDLAPQPILPGPAGPADPTDIDINDDMMDVSSPEASIAADTRVLLAVSITDDATCDIAQWKKWLQSDAPWNVTKIEVKVEAVFKSHSTLLIISLPTVAWDMLPNKDAYRFVGFVKSGNLSREPPCSSGLKQESDLIVNKQDKKLQSEKAKYQALDIGTPNGAPIVAREDYVTADAHLDCWNESETLKSNLSLQGEETKVTQEPLELANQHWEEEKRSLEEKLHLAEERLKAIQATTDPNVEHDTIHQDITTIETEAEPQLDPTECSNSQKLNVSHAGSVLSVTAQKLANALGHKPAVAYMKSEPALSVAQVANATLPFPNITDYYIGPEVLNEQHVRDEANPQMKIQSVRLTSTIKVEGTPQPTAQNANALQATASEVVAEMDSLPCSRKRSYTDASLSLPESPQANPEASSRRGEKDLSIQCVCGFDDNDGYTVLCRRCDTWQHVGCYYFNADEDFDVNAIKHWCVECKSMELDTDGARDRYAANLARKGFGQQERNIVRARSPSAISTMAASSGLSLLRKVNLMEKELFWRTNASLDELKRQQRWSVIAETFPEAIKDTVGVSPSTGTSGIIDFTDEFSHVSTSPGISTAKRAKRVHVCSYQGCGKTYTLRPPDTFESVPTYGARMSWNQESAEEDRETWDQARLENLATTYLLSRENMWRILASKTGEDWAVIEAKCFEKGLGGLTLLSRLRLPSTEPAHVKDDQTVYEDSAIDVAEGLSGIWHSTIAFEQ